jgi:hypothetical protein
MFFCLEAFRFGPMHSKDITKQVKHCTCWLFLTGQHCIIPLALREKLFVLQRMALNIHTPCSTKQERKAYMQDV